MAKVISNHCATIELFEDALRNRSEWPAKDDPAVKQVFETASSSRSRNKPTRKSDWTSMAFDIEDYQMV